MAQFTLTKEDILGHPLDEERYVLLSRLTELDLADHRTGKYERPLTRKRLQEIEEERKRLGLAESNPTRYVEAEAAIEAAEENDDAQGDIEE